MAAVAAVATVEPAASAAVATTATAIVAAAARTAVLVQAHGHERIDHLVELGEQGLDLLVGELGHERLAFLDDVAHMIQGVFVGEDLHLAHVHIARLGVGDLYTAHQVGLLGLGQQGVQLAQAHTQQVGHLLLLHAGLEVQELDGARQLVHLARLLLSLALEGLAATEQQVLGALDLLDQLLILSRHDLGVDVALVELVGVVLDTLNLGHSLRLGHLGLNSDLGSSLGSLDLHGLFHRLVVVLVLGHIVLLSRPSARPRRFRAVLPGFLL